MRLWGQSVQQLVESLMNSAVAKGLLGIQSRHVFLACNDLETSRQSMTTSIDLFDPPLHFKQIALSMQAEQVRKDRERIQELEGQLASSAADLQVCMLFAEYNHLVSLVEQSYATIYFLLVELATLRTFVRGTQRKVSTQCSEQCCLGLEKLAARSFGASMPTDRFGSMKTVTLHCCACFCLACECWAGECVMLLLVFYIHTSVLCSG